MRVVVVALVVLFAVLSTGGSARGQEGGGWRSYVLAPPKGLQKPERIVRVSGAVDNPDALVTGDGVTTLTYAEGTEPPTLTLDFGQVVGGFPQFDVEAVTGEPTLRASYSETRKGATPDGDYAGRARLTRVQLHTVRSPGAFRSRIIEGGQRYMRLALDVPGTVALSEAGIVFTPVRGTAANLRGHFLTSDRLLNRIWYGGVYTLNLNQIKAGFRQTPEQLAAENILIDGAKRDRRVWSGDLLTAGPSIFYSLDPDFVKNAIARFGSSPATQAVNRATAYGDISEPGPLPGVCSPHTKGGTRCRFWSAAYSMAFVVALADYFRYTGDAEFVRRQWQAVRRQMAWNATQVNRDTGLFETTPDTGATWNLEVFPGAQSSVNGMYHLALEDAAELAAGIKRKGAALYRARARRLKEAVNGQLWNAERGMYDLTTDYDASVVQDANVMPVLSGIASPEQASEAMVTLRDELSTSFGALNVSRPFPDTFRPVISPFMGALQVRAQFEAGRTADALGLIRTEWGYMVSTDPGGTMWEKIRPDGRLSPFSSAAHAWSTGTTAALSQYVLGAAPVQPGWKTWRVKPHPGDLTFTEGAVPTPSGPLDVDWRYERRAPERFTMRVRAPKGTSGSVWLPLYSGEHAVQRDGEVVYDGERDVRGDDVDVRRVDDYLVVADERGKHEYLWSSKLDRKLERQREREDGARDDER